MLHEVTGDILPTGARMLAHGVAPNDDFHSGLALALREHWPALYKDSRHWCKQTSPQPGGLWVWAAPSGLRIANLLTQEPGDHRGAHPGRARLEHVNHALRALHAFVEQEGIESLALPRLACGVGGLEWAQVRPLLAQHLGNGPARVYIYGTYRKGERAFEPA